MKLILSTVCIQPKIQKSCFIRIKSNQIYMSKYFVHNIKKQQMFKLKYFLIEINFIRLRQTFIVIAGTHFVAGLSTDIGKYIKPFKEYLI